MNRKFSIALVLVSAAAAAQGQSVFHFTSPQTPMSLQEAATVVRTVTDVPTVSTDATLSTLTFDGPAANIAMAQWVLTQLDTQGNERGALEYDSPAGDDVVRVNFLTSLSPLGPGQAMQEMLTVLRTVADISKIFNYTSREAIVIRAKAADMAFAEWIVDQLNLPPDRKTDESPRVYPGVTAHGMVARVNYLTNVRSPVQMQQFLTVLRTVGDIAKIFNYTTLHAVILRGPENYVDRAEWLIRQLDVPAGPQNAGAVVFRAPDADDLTRIFFLSNATDQGITSVLSALKTEAHIRKVFFTLTPLAIVVRGTADQVEAALQVMAQRNGLAMRETRPAKQEVY